MVRHIGVAVEGALLRAGVRLDYLHVGHTADEFDEVLLADARRVPELDLDLVAALAEPLAVDLPDLHPPTSNRPRHVTERVELAGVKPKPDRMRSFAPHPVHDDVEGP